LLDGGNGFVKPSRLEFGDGVLCLSVPDNADILSLPEGQLLTDPARLIRSSLLNPIGTPPLPEIIEKNRQEHTKAVIVVSDNTRPVPYMGESGILEPILKILNDQGVDEIEILVATGTHRPLSRQELKQLLPQVAFSGRVTVTNHICTDASSIRRIGRTARGADVLVASRYLDADIKILTGLVEPHFMAGMSGGRKSVCPGLIGEKATYSFHSARMIGDKLSDSLVLEGNPCHEEALEIARMSGVDFIVNVTIDRNRRLTGVYSGDLEQAHAAAAAKVMETNAIPIRHEYDMVVTHAGYVGRNHYQAAKACVEAVKAMKPGGMLIVAANNTDIDPIGSENYKRVLLLLKEYGPDAFIRKILSRDWDFVRDQWEVQIWIRAISKLGRPENLVYCSPQLTGALFSRHSLPGVDGCEGITGSSGRELAELAVQRAIDNHLAVNPAASIAILPDGPYGVPCRRQQH